MQMAKTGRKDPVAGEGRHPVAGTLKQKEEKMPDIGGLDFQPIPVAAARVSRPFDGYPMKKVKIGGAGTYSAYVVALNPTVQVRQDPANTKVKQKDGTFEQVRNHHSRFIRDYETGDNNEVVFDRVVKIGGREFFCAIVPSHNVRAQLCFKYDNERKRVEVDADYLFLDTAQDKRLKRVFEQIINPKLQLEREASFISGESKEDDEEQKIMTEEQV
jgi:hypothetical protein